MVGQGVRHLPHHTKWEGGLGLAGKKIKKIGKAVQAKSKPKTKSLINGKRQPFIVHFCAPP